MNKKYLKRTTTAQIMGTSGITLYRLVKGHNFPSPKLIGRETWYDSASVNEWLNLNVLDANHKGSVTPQDQLMTTTECGAMLGRSAGWTWVHITRDSSLTRIKILSKTLFIEREIREKFADILEVA